MKTPGRRSDEGEGEDEEDNGVLASTPPLIRWHQPVQTYLARATVRDESTLEVIAFVRSDLLVLRFCDRDSISHVMSSINPDVESM